MVLLNGAIVEYYPQYGDDVLPVNKLIPRAGCKKAGKIKNKFAQANACIYICNQVLA